MENLKEILFVIGVIPVAFIILLFRYGIYDNEKLLKYQKITVCIQLVATSIYITILNIV